MTASARIARAGAGHSFPRPVERPCSVATLLAETGTPADRAKGDLDTIVRFVAAPEQASAGCLAFVQADPAQARACAASVVVTSEPFSAGPGRCCVEAADPRRWFVRALGSLFPAPAAAISATALIAPSARIGAGVGIGPYSVVGEHVTIGDGTRLGSHVTIHDRCSIGAACTVQDHTAIGVSGVAYYRDSQDEWYGLPHLGIVAIGDDVDIGAHCVLARGILLDTIIRDHVKIGNFVNIGHNTVVEDGCWITSGVVLCGRVAVGRDVQIAAGANIRDKITIGERARIGLGTVVTKDVPPGTTLFGVPGRPLRTMGPF
jgi:UDP-3-O-[3-hydroxymyristoyl] glucosamine N-acyltransferase